MQWALTRLHSDTIYIYTYICTFSFGKHIFLKCDLGGSKAECTEYPDLSMDWPKLSVRQMQVKQRIKWYPTRVLHIMVTKQPVQLKEPDLMKNLDEIITSDCVIIYTSVSNLCCRYRCSCRVKYLYLMCTSSLRLLINPSTLCNTQVPLATEQPQSMMLPPPCLS